jgi:hypothetical protein
MELNAARRLGYDRNHTINQRHRLRGGVITHSRRHRIIFSFALL